jgi:hypothetical protein
VLRKDNEIAPINEKTGKTLRMARIKTLTKIRLGEAISKTGLNLRIIIIIRVSSID